MPRRILIVDDESAIRFAVCEYFAAYGYEVDSAPDEVTAKQMLEQHNYDAVIADMRLGGSEEYGGLEVIALAHRLVHRPCIVLLSADHSPQLVHSAKLRGADLALHKPLPLAELKGRISEFLAWRESGADEGEEFEPGQFVPTMPGGGTA